MRGRDSIGGKGASARERLVAVALLVLSATGLLATYAGAALTWDGASLLFAFLDVQGISVPHHRQSVALLQLPTLLLSQHVSNVRALEVSYGLSYTLLPALSAFASWRIVRKTHPRLIVWPLVFMGVGAVPGQLFFVTESLLAVHAVWPLFFVVLSTPSVERWFFAALIAAFLFELHPISGPLLVLAGAAAAARAVRRDSGARGFAIAAALLLTMGALRIWLSLHDSYELSQAGADLHDVFWSLRLPRVAVASMSVVPVALFAAHLVRRSGPLYVILAALGAVFVAALVPWARDPRAWQDALNYRFVAPFVAMPFLLGAGVVALATRPPNGGLSRGDALAGLGAALAFALILSIQSLEWLNLRRTLTAALSRSSPCLSMKAVPICRTTALRWWPTPSYALIIQGRAPRSLLLPGNACVRPSLRRVIPVNPWYLRPRGQGWFDLTNAGFSAPR